MLKELDILKEHKEKTIKSNYEEYSNNPLTQKDLDDYKEVCEHIKKQENALLNLAMKIALFLSIPIGTIVNLLNFYDEFSFAKNIALTALISLVVMWLMYNVIGSKYINKQASVTLKIDNSYYVYNTNLSSLDNSYLNIENIDPNHSVHKFINRIKELNRPILDFERELIIEKLKV